MVRNREPWKKLEAAMTFHGVHPKGSMHNALTDAIGCGEVYVARGLAAVTEANNAVLKAKLNKGLAENRVIKARKLRQRWRI